MITSPEAPDLGPQFLELVKTVPTLQWCKARLRYGVGVTEAQQNPEVMLVVLANELHRRETGRDDWNQFEQMSPTSLTTWLAERVDNAPDGAEVTADDTKRDSY